MIEFEEIKKIAQNKFPKLGILKCIDIGDRFAFLFTLKELGEGELQPPGMPVVCVNKSDGEVSYLTGTTIENEIILEKGRDVPLE